MSEKYDRLVAFLANTSDEEVDAILRRTWGRCWTPGCENETLEVSPGSSYLSCWSCRYRMIYARVMETRVPFPD